jgi:hypothetical protein
MKKDKSDVEQEMTAADKIWESVKDVKLEMFALPNQFVNMYCKPIAIEPTKLYLVTLNNATSVLPALEAALVDKYEVAKVDKFITITPSKSFK